MPAKKETKVQQMTGSEKRFRAIVEGGPGATCLLDNAGRPFYLSHGFQKITGYSEKAAGNANLLALVHPDDIDYVKSKFEVCLAHPGEAIRNINYRLKHSGGHWIWVESSFTNYIHDESIGGILYIFYAKDITLDNRITDALETAKNNLSKIMDSSMDMICTADSKGYFLSVSAASENILGYKPEEMVGKNISDFIFYEDLAKTIAASNSVRTGTSLGNFENRYVHKDGSLVYLSWSARWDPSDQIRYAIARNITEGWYYHELDKLEKDILESNAKGDKGLKETISRYLKGIEALHTGMLCSIQEIRDSRVYNLCAPNMPAGFLEAIEGHSIGRNAGSCGTAAFLKRKVIVTDIEHDPRWEDYKELAAQYHLKACWSHPIMDSDKNVMATFASYYREIRTPSKLEENTIQRAVHILQVILENYQHEQALKITNERFEYATEATSDIIWDWNLETNRVYYSANMKKLFGHTPSSTEDNLPFFYEHVHPDDRERVVLYPDQIKYGTITNWTQTYRFRKADGKYAYVQDKGKVIRDENGMSRRMVGAMQDITRQKEEEQRLKLFESVISNATDAVIITEAEQLDEPGPRILYVNEAFTKMTGYSAAEIVGKSPRMLQGPKSDRGQLEYLSKSLRRHQPYEVTLINYKKNGEEFWVNFTVSYLQDEKGKYTHFIAIERDITQQKNAELQRLLLSEAVSETLEEKNTILESIADAFFAVDKNWVVTYWNKMAAVLLGKPINQVIGHNLWDVFNQFVDSESYKRYHEAIETGQPVHFEDYYPPYQIWMDISCYPAKNGLSVYFKDVTDRKNSEIRMRQLNESLQIHAKELAVSNAELEQFAYVASHDLQEPLRMVTSFMTQLENKYGDLIDERGKQYIRFAVDGAKRMRQIILDLLDFSRVGRMENELEEVDFNKLVGEILVLHRKQVEELDAVVHYDGLPTMQTFKTPMRQVFQNLISNSLKYHRDGVPPVISIRGKETKTYCQFSVRDNGIGISSEFFDKIFIIFQRLHNREEYSGTGMGLAIAKKIIENLGGKIWVKSEEGKGSTFYFTILKSKKT